MNTLNEIAGTLKRLGDTDSLQEINSKQSEINSAWNNLLITLKRNKALYEKLSSKWSELNQKSAVSESQVVELEDQVNRLDKAVRSKQQLAETEKQIKVSSVKRLRIMWITLKLIRYTKDVRFRY